MPPKVFKILDYITDGVKNSSKYWDDAVRTAREASHVTSDLRVPINSVQRNGYSNLQHAKSQYKYFQNPRLARYDFEQIAPLSEFQRYLPKGQVGDPFGAMKLLEGTTNPYLRSVHRELKSFYPIGKQLQLSPIEIQRQMDLRLRDLFNNMYRVNTPMIFKMGGKVEKFWPGGLLGKGAKWLTGIKVARMINKAPAPKLNYISSVFDMSHPVGKYRDLIRGANRMEPVYYDPKMQWLDAPEGWTIKPGYSLLNDYPNMQFTPGGQALSDGITTMSLSSREGRLVYPNFKTKTMYDFGIGNYQPHTLITQRTKDSKVLPIKNGIMYPADYGNTVSDIWWERNIPFYSDQIVPTFVIDDIIPTESSLKKYGWGSSQSRVSGPVDLKDPSLNFRFITKDPVTGFPVESPFILPKETPMWQWLKN